MRLEMGLDFLSFTIHSGGLPRAFKILRDTPEQLKPVPSGLYGYTMSYRCPGVMVLFSADRQDVHIQLTSLACRYYGDSLLKMVPIDANVSRADLRCDVYNGLLNVDEIWRFLRRGNYCSTARSITYVSRCESDKYAGSTVYIGSPSSDVRLRIYDKGHEQETTDDPYKWVRYEFQFRNDAATHYFGCVKATNEAEAFYQSLHRFIRITGESRKRVEKYGNANRLKTHPKWYETFGQKIGRVFYRPFVRCQKFNTMMAYIRNAGSMLAVLRRARPGDFEDILHGYADMKEDKLKPHHEALLSEMTNLVFTGGEIIEDPGWLESHLAIMEARGALVC